MASIYPNRKNGKITKEKLALYMDFIVCEDYDESMMLAAHIRVGKRK